MKGLVTRAPHGKSFAFIKASNGVDHFLHYEEFRGNFHEMTSLVQQGQNVKVTFDSVENGEKGMRANNCKLVTDGDYNV